MSTERQEIIKELDETVSKLVIERDEACVVCGSKTDLQNGHVFSRRYWATRWDIHEVGNCHCQCSFCNSDHGSWTMGATWTPYVYWFVETFGREALNQLWRRAKQLTNYKTYELKELLKDIKQYEVVKRGQP